MSREIQLLEEPYFSTHWPKIEANLNAMPHLWLSWTTLDLLYTDVMQRRVQCWAMGDERAISVVVFTQVATFPYRRLQVMLALGEGIEPFLDLLNATLEKFAQMQDCGEAEVFGRPGWKRMLEPFGFKQKHVVLVKPIEIRSIN